jgi:fucose 4-O-acetylase-like acetyltransferase
MKQRLEYIDIAKGLGIIFATLCHTEHWELAYYTLAFNIPIFFFCSGYTSSKKDINLTICFGRQAIKLLKPYLFFNILLLFYFHDFSLRAIFGIFYSRYCLFPFGTVTDIFPLFIVGNYPMWFLTCMVVAYLLYDLLIYYPKYQYWLIATYLVITTCATFLPILLPWSLDTAPLTAIIMFCGTQIRKYVPNIFSNRKPHILILLSFISYCVLIPFCDGINISIRNYGSSILTYFLAAICGSIVLIYVARLIQKTILGTIIKQIGNHSMTIFCIEIPFILLGKQFSNSILPDMLPLHFAVLTSFIQLTFALAGGYLFSLLLHKNKHIQKIVY